MLFVTPSEKKYQIKETEYMLIIQVWSHRLFCGHHSEDPPSHPPYRNITRLIIPISLEAIN